MRIAIDSGPLSDGHAGRGIGVYTKLLAESLVEVVAKRESNLDLIDVSAQSDLSKYDIIHYPSFDFFSPTLHVPNNIPVVVTIHDTIPLIYPKHYPPGIKGSINLLRQKHALKRVSAVITDSRTSEKDIIRLLGVKASRVHPIYLGPTVTKPMASLREKDILKKYQIDFPYVIYIGDVNWNKNLVNLSQACEDAKLHLVIVGKKAVSSNYDRNHAENRSLVELQTKFAESKFVHRVGFVLEEELPFLITKATLLCQPSFYEGFGLSVLDAMSLETPTVCAKTQTLVELYEEGSIFFDPYDVSNMSQVLLKVFESKALQKDLSTKGKALATEFSWKHTATKTYEVYESLISSV